MRGRERELRRLVTGGDHQRGVVVAIRAGQLQVAGPLGTRFIPVVEGASVGSEVVIDRGTATVAPAASAEVYWL